MSESTQTPPFEFQGVGCGTIGELLDGARAAVQAGCAPEFLAAYRAYSEHADANLGYVFGYVEPPERRRELYEAFGLVHPIFGGAV